MDIYEIFSRGGKCGSAKGCVMENLDASVEKIYILNMTSVG